MTLLRSRRISPKGTAVLRSKSMRSLAVTALAAALLLPAGVTSFPGMTFASNKGASGLPLPRYVSLKSSRVNMRVGPGRDYKVQWLYTKRGLPLEILQEYDNWRKVRDPEGDEGWILQSLLSGKRTALVSPWAKGETESVVDMYDAPNDASGIRARLQPGVLAEVSECINGWCKLEAGEMDGYVKQSSLWGVYPDESFK